MKCTNSVKSRMGTNTQLTIIIIIIIRRLVMRTMSEYMTESEARAVARWDVGSCLRMVHKTKHVGFKTVLGCFSLTRFFP